MEIERDVEIQIIEGEKDPEGNLRAGFSSGPHASRQLPAYSEAERRSNLGSTVVDHIRSVFALARDADRGNAPATGQIGAAPFRGGW
jgi:hypothetical protein